MLAVDIKRKLRSPLGMKEAIRQSSGMLGPGKKRYFGRLRFVLRLFLVSKLRLILMWPGRGLSGPDKG